MKKTLLALLAIFCLAAQSVQATFYCSSAKVFVSYREGGELISTKKDEIDTKILGISAKCSGALCDSAPSNPTLKWNEIKNRWDAWWQATNKGETPEIVSIRLQCKESTKTLSPPK